MSKASADEAYAALERSRTLLDADGATDRLPEIAEPELSREEILREALAQPLETVNERHRRKLDERDAGWAAQRAKREATMAEASPPQPQPVVSREQEASSWNEWCRIKGYVSDVLGVIDEDFADCHEEFQKQTDRIAALEAEVKALRGQRAQVSEPIDIPALDLRRRLQ